MNQLLPNNEWKWQKIMTENNKLPQVNFARNYLLLLAFIIPMTVIGICFLGVFTIPMIISLNNGLRLTGYEILSAAIVNILVLGLVFFAWVVGYTESSIEFTEISIRKKRIFQTTAIRWSEVISVYMIGTRITIRSQNKKIQLNTIYYHEPDKLIKFIRDHHRQEDDTLSF
jgi:hypothetical protein